MIEIKELIIRATVDSLSAQTNNGPKMSDIGEAECAKTYLESIVDQLKNNDER